MEPTPMARLSRRLVLWLQGARRCDFCGAAVSASTGVRAGGTWACSDEHAQAVERERAW